MNEIFMSFEIWFQSFYSSLTSLQIINIAVHAMIPPLLFARGFYNRLYEWRSINRYVALGTPIEVAMRRARKAYRCGEKITLRSRLFDRIFLYYINRTAH